MTFASVGSSQVNYPTRKTFASVGSSQVSYPAGRPLPSR